LAELRPPANAAHRPLAVDDISARILRAQALLSLERTAEAANAASEALDTIVRSPLRDKFQSLEANATLVLGKALQRSGDAAHARSNLERALQLRQADTPGASPWVAEAEIALANCLIDLGERGGARSFFGKAAAIFASHSEIGEQFKKPADALAQRLKRSR